MYLVCAAASQFLLIYIDLFLMYLVVRFSREKENTKVEDPITNKKVPNVVFL